MSITVEQIATHKTILESGIRSALTKAIEKFAAATGYTPNNISISFIELPCTVSELNNKSRFVLSGVKTNIPLLRD